MSEKPGGFRHGVEIGEARNKRFGALDELMEIDRFNEVKDDRIRGSNKMAGTAFRIRSGKRLIPLAAAGDRHPTGGSAGGSPGT